MKKILANISTIISGLLLIIGLTAIVMYLLGFRFYAVITGSMGQTYPVGTLLVVDNGHAEDVKAGDVISFTVDENLTVVTHRVTDVFDEYVYTKGDANNNIDGTPVYKENIIGRVLFGIPLMGNLIELLHTTAGLIVIGVIIGILVIILIMQLLHKETKEELGE